MQYTIPQLEQVVYQRVNEVYDTFKGFFGEEYVDLPKEDSIIYHIKSFLRTYNFTVKLNDETTYELSDVLIHNLNDYVSARIVYIYVWWPRVTVTNEHNKSIDIQDLYAKIPIQLNGRIPYEYPGFQLNRATYSEEQFLSNYLHSHIKEIPKYDFTQFMNPCLGQGPIRETIMTLKNDYDEVTWMLFCQELSMYVTVESLSGGPWKKLENVGDKKRLYSHTCFNLDSTNNYNFTDLFSTDILKEFIEYYLKNGHLSISYKNNQFCCGLTYFEYIIDVSNSFIDFYNKYLYSTREKLEKCYSSNVLISAIAINEVFYSEESNNAVPNLDIYRGKHVLNFKGKDIKITIEKREDTSSESFVTTVLNQGTAMYILKSILRTINFRYNNDYNNKQRDQSSTTTCKRAIYL